MNMAHHEPSLDVSVVVPLLDEQESLKELRQRIGEAMAGLSYEVIFVDDGSRDGSWDIIEGLHGATPGEVKGIRLARNYGKSAALQKGFEAAQGRVVFTMDADLQDDPKELPAMRQQLLDEELDLVSGWKKPPLPCSTTRCAKPWANAPSKWPGHATTWGQAPWNSWSTPRANSSSWR